MAIKIHHVDLSEPLEAIRATAAYESVRVLVRHLGRPLGWVEIKNAARRPRFSRERVGEEIAAQLPWQLLTGVLGRRFEPHRPVEALPRCSVIVCTRDRTELLAGCLRSVLDLDYPDFEVLVVDNAPSDDSTRTLVSGMPVRYTSENRPGLDWARNRGLLESRGEIVAFVDDDARPDRRWLRAIAGAFAEPEVMAVSGMVAPLELETRAQILFELSLGGMTQSLHHWTVRASHITRTQLLWSSSFSVGTNMAYRRSLFDSEAVFDPALDVGTPSGSGGDIELCHRLVANGHTLVYEPAALVWHVHRRSYSGLRRQLHTNQLGFGSYLWTCMRNRTLRRSSILRFALKDWLWGWILRRLLRPGAVPRDLVWAELRGALGSPFAYRAAQRHARRLAAFAPVGSVSGRVVVGQATPEAGSG